MSDITPLARQLVDSEPIRWEAGMLTTSGHRLTKYDSVTRMWHGCGPKGTSWWHYPADMVPDLEDEATAALLAVQAMERGRCFEHFTADEYGPAGWRLEGERPEYATLGEAAARALLAQPTTKETA
jgi:hypothetical protein